MEKTSWKRHLRGRIRLLILLFLLTLTVLWVVRRPERIFNGTISITFTEKRFGPEKNLTITDASEVQRIVSTIHLVRKDPCQCSHIHEVTFLKSSERIEVSICEHCFAILGPMKNGWYPNVKDYWMPADFYSEFQKLALKQTNQNWHVGSGGK